MYYVATTGMHWFLREEADHPLLFKAFNLSSQSTLGSAGLSGSLCCALVEKGDRAHPFIELLFRPESILLDFLPIIRSFATRTVGSGHHRYLAECCFALYCTPLQHVQTSGVARQSLEPVCVYHPLAKCGVSKNRFHNELKLNSPDEVDEELIGWLKDAYTLG